MANYKWPNVYANITDLSGVVATNAVTSCAYVGEAEFGPINKPTFLSTLKDYTAKFGALNSAKYGYAGYSLAVASESIDSHYFVRTVKAGPNADTGKHEADDAKYGSVKIPSSKSTASISGNGWYVEEIEAIEKTENASGLFTESNYRIKSVSVKDAGINYAVDTELTIPLDVAAGKAKVTELQDEYKVTSITVVASGTDFINNEDISIALDGENFVGRAVVDPDDPEGKLVSVSIINGGISSVVRSDTIGISTATGTGAAVTLGMENTGKIKSVELIDAGKSELDTEKIDNPLSVTSEVGSGATVNVVMTNLDEDNAMIFVADNPNNLRLGVTITDSTVNENKAYIFENVTYTQVESGVYDALVTKVDPKVIDGLVVGDMIVISRSNRAEQEGIFTVTGVTDSTVTYRYKPAKADDEVIKLEYGKISKYPAPNERTFQVDVWLTKGRLVQNVETYQFCTLYQNKDAYGNSTFVEDVINGSSDYVKVYVNQNLLDALDEEEVLEPRLVTSVAELTGGQSGGKPTSNDLNNGWELFRDRTQTSVSLLLNSGYTNKDEPSYQNKMLEIAEYRRDCFCLFDIPMTEVEPEDAIDWRKNILGITSYRAALSSPWVRTYDSVQGRANFVMCPSAFLAKLIGAAGDPWHAPAGPNRGILSSATVSPTGLTQAYDSAIGGTLYADNQINCIVRDVAAGYVNWGQRTLQAKPSALDRINVARTVIYIETILRDAARWHLFENNTPYERMQITLQFSAFLDTILSADGIAAYRVICDTTNNTPIVIANNQLVIDVILTPVYAAESIILNTTITGADASVDITSSAN